MRELIDVNLSKTVVDEVMETSAIDASMKLEGTYGGGPKNNGDDKKVATSFFGRATEQILS